MPLGRKVDLGSGNIVLDGNPAPPKRGAQRPQFWPMYCGQTAAWIKMPLGTGLGLCPSEIVLHGDPAPPQRGKAASPIFGPSVVAERLDVARCHLIGL